MRTDGATTTAISTTQCDLADCGPEKDVSFVGATPSGSSAFLLTEQRLTDADSDSGADLYRYDVASGRLTLLSADRGGGNLIPTAQPVLASEDGSRVYFEAREETGPGETNGPNLYAVNGSGSPRLVVSDVEATEAQSTFVSSDGRYALFTTDAPLEAGDTDEKMDVYRYDIEQGSATRISTGPSGGNGSFDAELFEESERPAPVFTFPLHGLSRRAMSEDGSRIFFTTAEQLVPQDHNEVVDVYEWADGNLGLVSSGAGTNGSEYLSATPDGGTVFFATSDVLVPSDRDGADKDIYAARIGGGFAEGPAARGCEGASCVARTVPPGRPVPTSARPDAGGIRLKPIDAAARRLILSTGWISLLVEVPGSGRLSAAARARIGHRSRTVASGSATVTPGPARLRMRLTKRARQTLASGHGLHVRLSLRLSGLDSVRRVGFELRSGK
jgi:hypothetical protein